MSEKAMRMLEDTLCNELDQIAEKGELSAGDLEAVHKLTDTIKNIYKIDMLKDADGYSGGDWMAEGSYGRRYSDDDMNYSNYSGRNRHYVRGHYSYANGRSRGRMYSHDDGAMYSMADGMEMVKEKMQKVINKGNLPEADMRTLREAMDMLK